jgi:phytoene dehydrogenase-like protein
VTSRADLPPARAYVFDTAPRVVADVFADRLSTRAEAGLRRFRHGDAAAKVDLVLSGPVPWAVPEVGRASTVHVGGTRAEMAQAEADVAAGRHAGRPVVLVSDPTVVDPGRAAGGLRPLWTYAHVPAGSDRDVTEDVVAQIERFAPGFRDVVVASRCIPAAEMSRHDESYVGGDIAGGAVTMWQMVARPALRADPYAVGLEGVYLCSASTPPGPGVHGLGGWYAARRVLRREFDVRDVPDLSPGPSR